MFLLVQLYPVQLTVLKFFSQVLICRLLYISNLFLERLILDFDPRPNLFAPIIAWTPDSWHSFSTLGENKGNMREKDQTCVTSRSRVLEWISQLVLLTLSMRSSLLKEKKHILSNNYYHVVIAVISVQSSGGYSSFFQGVTKRFDGLTTCLRDTQLKEVLGTNCWRSPAFLAQPVQPRS